MRSSGAKGLPLRMPMALKNPSETGSSESLGSSCTTWLSSSHTRKSPGATVLKGFCDRSTNFGAGTRLPASASG